jgi:hypothetical protein
MYECTLLSTREEIEVSLEDNPKKSLDFQKVRFVSKCGHEAQGYFVNVKSKGTGVLCKECSKAASSKKLKEFVKDYMKNAVKDIFEVVKINEGCLAHFIIRPIGVQSDDWLKIQLKTTLDQSLGLYGFAMKGKSYPNCLIVCVCLGDKRTWILDGETKMCEVFTEMYKTKPLKNSNYLLFIMRQEWARQERLVQDVRVRRCLMSFQLTEARRMGKLLGVSIVKKKSLKRRKTRI